MAYHIQRRITDAPVRKSEVIEVERTKNGREIPKTTLVEVAKGHVN